MPDPADEAAAKPARPPTRVAGTIWALEHAQDFVTVAVGVMLIGLAAVIRRILFVLSSEVRVDTTELGLLILMLIAFVASFLAVSWFERRES
jgi:uncharacterized membrane protein